MYYIGWQITYEMGKGKMHYVGRRLDHVIHAGSLEKLYEQIMEWEVNLNKSGKK
jgi:hypothetical protein